MQLAPSERRHEEETSSPILLLFSFAFPLPNIIFLHILLVSTLHPLIPPPSLSLLCYNFPSSRSFVFIFLLSFSYLFHYFFFIFSNSSLRYLFTLLLSFYYSVVFPISLFIHLSLFFFSPPSASPSLVLIIIRV